MKARMRIVASVTRTLFMSHDNAQGIYGDVIRKAVEHDANTMRFYLKCSVGELALRLVLASAPSGTGTTAAELLATIAQRVSELVLPFGGKRTDLRREIENDHYLQALLRSPAGAGTPPEVVPGTEELSEWTQRVKDTVFYARVHCREKGYALAAHGSLRRDIDLVAVPWTDEACSAEELAQYLYDSLAKLDRIVGWGAGGSTPEQRPHGRLSWAMMLASYPVCYIDLSVAPRAASPAPLPAGGREAVERVIDRIIAGLSDSLLAKWACFTPAGCKHQRSEHDEPVRQLLLMAALSVPRAPKSEPKLEKHP